MVTPRNRIISKDALNQLGFTARREAQTGPHLGREATASAYDGLANRLYQAHNTNGHYDLTPDDVSLFYRVLEQHEERGSELLNDNDFNRLVINPVNNAYQHHANARGAAAPDQAPGFTKLQPGESNGHLQPGTALQIITHVKRGLDTGATFPAEQLALYDQLVTPKNLANISNGEFANFSGEGLGGAAIELHNELKVLEQGRQAVEGIGAVEAAAAGGGPPRPPGPPAVSTEPIAPEPNAGPGPGVRISHKGDGKPGPVAGMRKAGGRLLDFMSTPVGMALTDGIVGAGLITLPLVLSQDAPPSEEALQMGGAMAGATAMGLGGYAAGQTVATKLFPPGAERPPLPANATLRQRMLEPMPRGRLAGHLVADLVAGLGIYGGWQAGGALAHSTGLDRKDDGTTAKTTSPS